MDTFIICRYAAKKPTKINPNPDPPMYAVYTGNKVYKDYNTGDWTKSVTGMVPKAWEQLVSKELHLKPGGGPLRIKVLKAKNQDIKKFRYRKG